MELLKCGLSEPHMFHPHSVAVELRCSGQTPCGEQTHEPHITAKVARYVWCRGVCDCRIDRLGDHGPGEHK